MLTWLDAASKFCQLWWKQLAQYLCYYNYVNDGGESVHGCQKAFLSIHDVSHGHCRSSAEGGQKLNGGIPKTNQWREHTNRPNRIHKEDIVVKTHIETFPRYISHYSRKDREYLSPELNISRLYGLYVSKCREEGRSPVKQWAYHHIFRTQ